MSLQSFISEDKNWQTILENELMEKRTITPRTLSILKEEHEHCDPNVLMNLRHKTPKGSPKKRESVTTIMEIARKNLKAEYRDKNSQAMFKRAIDSEVEKFKQHLTNLRRINASSSRLPYVRRPSLKARFHKIAIRTRSCRPSVVKIRRNKIAEFGSQDDLFNSAESEMGTGTFNDFPPPSKRNWVGTPSVDSLDVDVSLPAVYGSSLTSEIPHRGPNTTPTSLLSEISPSEKHGDKMVWPSLEEEFLPELYEEDLIPLTPQHSVQYNAEYAPIEECSCDIIKVEDSVTSETQEKKRKVKNTAYKQLMSYVCSKSTRVKQVPVPNTTDKPFVDVGDGERSSQREHKIALVLEYLQRKKNSPDSSLSVTPPDLERKAPSSANPTVSLDPKPVRGAAAAGTYEHRFQAQRDLIKKQRAQLAEQQKKIQQLTLAKLQQESRNSQEDFQKTIEELEEHGTLSIRPQLKTLKSSGNSGEFSSAGKIVERMEKRAKEREEKKQIAAERRKVLEEERKKKMAEEEERQRKEEEEKKKQAFEKTREEKIRQRESRERIRNEQERLLELHRRAETFNNLRLCKTGLRAFRRLLVIRNELFAKAQQYHEKKRLRTAFSTWKKWVHDKVAEKYARADLFYNRVLLRNSFNNWKKELIETVQKRQVAEDMYEMRLQEKVFQKWCKYVNEQHLIMEENLHLADQWCTRLLLKKAFSRWRVYPKIAHLEREKEQRKKILRQKVKDMLPDFRPETPDY